MTLHRLIFFIHPFCYVYIANRGTAPADWPYLPLEADRTQRWSAAVATLPDDAALALVPFASDSVETRRFSRLAVRRLGPRFIVLKSPGYLSPDFWRGHPRAGLAAPDLLADLRAACTAQGTAWNKEELETSLHARACAAELQHELRRRGLRLDSRRLDCEAWGASFEGCVTKYSLSFRRLLGLPEPITIDFEMTVPDAKFLLDAQPHGHVTLNDHLRLYLFQRRRRPLGLFVATSHAMSDRARHVRLPPRLANATVQDKRGVRLWPNPVFKPFGAGHGLDEPPQALVRTAHGRLHVPVCFGFVYRLAKAPAFVLAPPGMAMAEFRRGMSGAQPVDGAA